MSENNGKISIKNIESNNPVLHDFVIDYWKFAVRFTPALSGEEWWETLYSEINYYIDKYAGNPFICDVIGIQLEAMTSKFYKDFQKSVMSSFIKDWGIFLNDYVYEDQDEKYWERLSSQTDILCDRYRNISFLQEIINRSVFSLCGKNQQIVKGSE